MSRLIGVYGASGCGRGIMPLVREDAAAQKARLLFVDDGAAGQTVNGAPVLSWDAFLNEPESNKAVAIAIANRPTHPGPAPPP